jgi:hypothetical protein
MNLLIIIVVRNLVKEVSLRSTYFDEQTLKEIVENGKKKTLTILKDRFECAETVINSIFESVWIN